MTGRKVHSRRLRVSGGDGQTARSHPQTVRAPPGLYILSSPPSLQSLLPSLCSSHSTDTRLLQTRGQRSSLGGRHRDKSLLQSSGIAHVFFVTAEDGGVTAGPGLRLGHTLDRVSSTSRRANSLKRTSLEGVGGGGGEFLLLHILSVSYHCAPTVEGPGNKQSWCETCWCLISPGSKPRQGRRFFRFMSLVIRRSSELTVDEPHVSAEEGQRSKARASQSP